MRKTGKECGAGGNEIPRSLDRKVDEGKSEKKGQNLYIYIYIYICVCVCVCVCVYIYTFGPSFSHFPSYKFMGSVVLGGYLVYIYKYIYTQDDPPKKKTEPINFFYYFFKNKTK